jgi:hypothetical protein
MFLLILGLVLFLGAHSVRVFAEDWRTGMISRLGAQRWKGVYSLVSILGFILIVWGFAQARHGAPQLWAPPVWARHLNLLVMLVSLILFAAANPRPSHYKYDPASSDGLGRDFVERRASAGQWNAGRRRAVRRVFRLGRARSFRRLCARPARARRLRPTPSMALDDHRHDRRRGRCGRCSSSRRTSGCSACRRWRGVEPAQAPFSGTPASAKVAMPCMDGECA